METFDMPGSEEEAVLTASSLPPDEPELHDRLVPGDLIAIQVYEEPGLSLELIIPLGGEVSYPEIGNVQLVGRTIKEVETDIRARLEDKLTSPQVTVLLKGRNKRSAYVLGSVRNPGSYEIPFGKSLTVLQALSEAGGFTESADRDCILLMRNEGDKQATYRIAYSELVKKTGQGKDVNLKDGDILAIPELAKVYVLGKVNAPGGFVVPAEEKFTLTKAISLAKGYSPVAAQNRTTIIRSLPDGTTRIFRINVNDIFSGSLRDPVILPGDVVFVPESVF
jgi:polysaccharide export outer membrane protein